MQYHKVMNLRNEGEAAIFVTAVFPKNSSVLLPETMQVDESSR